MRRYKLIQHLRAALQAINGAGGYRTDLKGKVFLRNRRPNPADLELPPYVCVPLLEENGLPQVSSTGLIQLSWQQEVIGILPVTTMDPSEPGLTRAVADLHDDLLVCLSREVVSSLGGFADDFAIESISSDADASPESPYGIVIFRTRIMQVMDEQPLLLPD